MASNNRSAAVLNAAEGKQANISRAFTFTRYMQRPPNIMPNYGKKSPKLGVPKTSLSRVLLYDNITQQQMLDVKLANIKIERQRAEYLMNMHKRSFSLGLANKRRKQREYGLKETKKTHFPPLDPSKRGKSPTIPPTPLLRRISTLSLNDVKLPSIDNHKKQVVLKLKTKSGKKRTYYSNDESGIFVDFVPIHTLYESVRDDPRFQKLETALMPAEDEGVDGFVILSPSYEKKYPKIPEFLLEMLEENGDRNANN